MWGNLRNETTRITVAIQKDGGSEMEAPMLRGRKYVSVYNVVLNVSIDNIVLNVSIDNFVLNVSIDNVVLNVSVDNVVLNVDQSRLTVLNQTRISQIDLTGFNYNNTKY